MDRFTEKSCEEYIALLASDAPAPGGGGACALCGALGTALAAMVGSLTLGKKKYADVQDEVVALKASCMELQDELVGLAHADAEVFLPLSRAYGMPKDTPELAAEKARVMEAALYAAALVPLDIMAACCRAIDIHARMAEIGSAIAISDVGCGVAVCKAALMGANLNVRINVKYMTDAERATALRARADGMLAQYLPLADQVYDAVAKRFD